MSLIDGIGDEVLHFFIALIVCLIIMLAWKTTNIGEHWHIHTFYLLDRNLLRRLRNHRRLTNHIEVATISESTMTSSENHENNLNVNENHTNLENNEVLLQSDEEQEQSDIVQAMDGDRCSLRQRRLVFYENAICNNETTLENQAVTTDENKESMQEKDALNCESTNDESHDNTTDNTPNIRIKLKYINDDLKLVEGRLEEHIGDFKRRHFNEEMSSNKLVKLIFNGQILERDNDTLQHCGLFDNCVVHCLIHPIRITQNEENVDRSDTNRSSNAARLGNNSNLNREWDFGNMLIGLLSFILGTAWYFRYQYPHLFTVTATVALVAVTGIFTVISVGMYFPDPEPGRQEIRN